MKRLAAFVCILVFMFSISACGQVSVSTNAQVTLRFVYEDKDIHVTLDDSEAARVIDILNGGEYDLSVLVGAPSCGFNENVALAVGDRRFAIACDTCNCIQDLGNFLYFYISREDMAYIHALFEKYGGYFPCV